MDVVKAGQGECIQGLTTADVYIKRALFFEACTSLRDRRGNGGGGGLVEIFRIVKRGVRGIANGYGGA